jgi:hypothetical protein
MRNKWALLLAVAALFLFASATQADLLPPPNFKVSVELMPTQGGTAVAASGWATIVRSGDEEYFALETFSKLDGVVLTVYGLSATDEWFLIGTFKLQFGGGSFYVEKGAPGEPKLLFPVTNLRQVAVYARTVALLRGNFELIKE